MGVGGGCFKLSDLAGRRRIPKALALDIPGTPALVEGSACVILGCNFPGVTTTREILLLFLPLGQLKG